MKPFTLAKSRRNAKRRQCDWFVLISFSRKAREPKSHKTYFVCQSPGPLEQLAAIRNRRQASRDYRVVPDRRAEILAMYRQVANERRGAGVGTSVPYVGVLELGGSQR